MGIRAEPQLAESITAQARRIHALETENNQLRKRELTGLKLISEATVKLYQAVIDTELLRDIYLRILHLEQEASDCLVEAAKENRWGRSEDYMNGQLQSIRDLKKILEPNASKTGESEKES